MSKVRTNTECCICTENIEEKQNVMRCDRCKKIHHLNCLTKCIKAQCPLCRFPMPFEPAKKQVVERASTPRLSDQFILNSITYFGSDTDGEAYHNYRDCEICEHCREIHTCIEDCPEYDEENPQGDDYDYPDEEDDPDNRFEIIF